MSIEENKIDRLTASGFIASAGERRPRFWECVRDLAAEKLPRISPPTTPEPMSYDEARGWGRLGTFPRGNYSGAHPIDVPKSYCTWWADGGGGDPFTQHLIRYVRSQYFKELPD